MVSVNAISTILARYEGLVILTPLESASHDPEGNRALRLMPNNGKSRFKQLQEKKRVSLLKVIIRPIEPLLCRSQTVEPTVNTSPIGWASTSAQNSIAARQKKTTLI
jgi:hypothetical protein